MRIAWTGHRPELFAEPGGVEHHVDAEVARLQRVHPELTIICGGQRGVDLWVAEAALRLRAPLEVILPEPIRVFAGAWSENDRARLGRVAGGAQRLDIVDMGAALGALAYDLRNERMVLGADLLVAVWTGIRRGGTFETLCAAASANVNVHELLFRGAPGAALTGRGL